MVADKGKMGFFFFFFLPPAPVFIHLEKKTLSISFSCYTSDYILVFGLPGGSRLPLSPQDVYGKGASGAGPRRAWTLGANPHRAPRLLPAQAKTPFGSAFVFPTPVTFAEVQPASGAPGVRAVAFPSTPKDDNRLGSRGEGEGGGRAGLGAETPTPALAPSPSSETPSQTAGVRAGGGSPPAGEARVGLPAVPPSAPPPSGPGPDSPAPGAAAALSFVGCGEPSLLGAGRRLRTPGRRLSRRLAPSPASRLFLGGCGGAGRSGGMRAGGEAGSSEASAPAGEIFSPLPSPARASAARYRLDPFQG